MTVGEELAVEAMRLGRLDPRTWWCRPTTAVCVPTFLRNGHGAPLVWVGSDNDSISIEDGPQQDLGPARLCKVGATVS